MRPANSNAISYSPGDPPIDPGQLQRFLREELAKISASISALAAGHLDKTTEAPAKQRDGDIRYADGANWDPGGGKGLYMFNGSIWTLIKALP
jgi:hypothetical protein